MNIENEFKEFLDENIDVGAAVLVGFSGGADSLALLHLLMHYSEKYRLTVHVAHVDHRWREESDKEAASLRDMVEGYGMTFHLKVLDPKKLTGNLEAACRDERIQFFSDLCKEHDLSGVFLGHHSDDQAETVLKRIFEGSFITNISALAPVANIFGLTVWRPLITVPKKEICRWIEKQVLKPIEDTTNADTRYTRARMRHNIIPQLEEQFGKEISGNICHLAEEARETKELLEEEIAPILAKKKSSPLATWIDLTTAEKTPHIILTYLLRKMCNVKDHHLTRDMAKTLVKAITTKKAGITIFVGTRTIIADRGHLFIMEGSNKGISGKLPLIQGQQRYGNINVTVKKAKTSEHKKSSWKDLWSDEGATVVVPQGDYTIGIADTTEQYPRTSPIKKLWTNRKVPAFLRDKVPVLYKDGIIYHDFLSGEKIENNEESNDMITVAIKA
ncbi:MAG: tRNA lysidine(34) synthetase TilS [Waddliaceae bacterium]|jgi:tRNA(Ile)-lysidine synthase|nr:tRNA lysidine(34) synthetase TilS [Waddliaceae bacterium]MBT3579118.1 tRNA lysidine(34) synthetase TilS [Waddliaceae bacterium]MBT4444911.1 tRNA lysidine(34) synthetase TilS [Waddliaceae bacterium]MBT6927936.1 tRNA lysidine(34) synthetase TilS [Waddliaceae bacterium]MBT7264802.1 tRNA lysidine(34) synthetase TilS [Waddliaceae bacterium]